MFLSFEIYLKKNGLSRLNQFKNCWTFLPAPNLPIIAFVPTSKGPIMGTWSLSINALFDLG